jgi:hypothetical protein
VFLIGFLIASLLIYSPNSFIEVHASDAYGNDIKWIYVEQYNGTAWNLVYNYTSSGGSNRILDNQKINFTVFTCLNKTYASSTAEALSFSRVNVTISTGGSPISGWSNIPCNQSATVLSDATYYYVTSFANWTTPLAIAGSTYNCTFVYQAYF